MSKRTCLSLPTATVRMVSPLPWAVNTCWQIILTNAKGFTVCQGVFNPEKQGKPHPVVVSTGVATLRHAVPLGWGYAVHLDPISQQTGQEPDSKSTGEPDNGICIVGQGFIPSDGTRVIPWKCFPQGAGIASCGGVDGFRHDVSF